MKTSLETENLSISTDLSLSYISKAISNHCLTLFFVKVAMFYTFTFTKLQNASALNL